MYSKQGLDLFYVLMNAITTDLINSRVTTHSEKGFFPVIENMENEKNDPGKAIIVLENTYFAFVLWL